MNLPVVFHDRAFTLVELLLVCSLIMIVSVFMFPLGLSFYQAQMLNETQEGILSALRRAQDFSLTGKNQSVYGVRITDEAYVVFEGSSYATRSVSEDEIYSIPGIIEVGGVSEVTFASFTGVPSTQGIVSLILHTRDAYVEISPAGVMSTQ